MKSKTWVKSLLSMLCIVVGGFILFNLAFMLAALFINTLMYAGGAGTITPGLGRIIFAILVYAISWLIFRSKLNDLIKATYLTMPLMVTLVMIGIFAYQLTEIVVYVLGAVVIAAVAYYIYKKKLSWLYYFATAYVGLVALIVMVAGIEI